jgi:hypothetical protein
MAEYRNYLIQPARLARRKRPRITSHIQVLRKEESCQRLLKQFRFVVESDASLLRAIERAKRYVDYVADRDLVKQTALSAQRPARHTHSAGEL